jgi:hypothetical protein
MLGAVSSGIWQLTEPGSIHPVPVDPVGPPSSDEATYVCYCDGLSGCSRCLPRQVTAVALQYMFFGYRLQLWLLPQLCNLVEHSGCQLHRLW